MPSMSRDRWLKEWELKLDKEFELDGKPAEWAPSVSGPSLWGSEDAKIELRRDDPQQGNVSSSSMAVSDDEKLLAVSTNAVIRVYDPETKILLSELRGHLSNVQKLRFAPSEAEQTDVKAADDTRNYVLLSEGARVSGLEGTIISWPLDAKGRQLKRNMPIAVDNFTSRALDNISPDLRTHHDLDDAAIESIRSGFREVLQEADTKNRAANLQSLTGHFPSFRSNPISHNKTKMFYIIHGQTTQNGMRPPEELPQLVVYSLKDQKEICRLKGHEDAIMWAGWCPHYKTIATASWDQTFRIWDSQTGKLQHLIGPTGGQCWTGAFSPTGQNVIFSGAGDKAVHARIYNVQTGREVTKLPEHEGLGRWLRYFAWDQGGDEDIAFLGKQAVLLWKPFPVSTTPPPDANDSPSRPDSVQTILRLHSDGSMLDGFCGMSSISWLDDGRKLAVRTSDDTMFVWDRNDHVKWRFQRPSGTALGFSGGGYHLFADKGILATLNGDWTVRFWKL